jgi:hypothetical protein
VEADNHPLPVLVCVRGRHKCWFPVFLQGTGTDINISWALADGSTRSFDALTDARLTVTNLGTLKSVTVSYVGSDHTTIYVDGSGRVVSTGPAVFIGFPALPGINSVPSRWVGTRDTSGQITIQSLNGTVRDLCAAVAP